MKRKNFSESCAVQKSENVSELLFMCLFVFGLVENIPFTVCGIAVLAAGSSYF